MLIKEYSKPMNEKNSNGTYKDTITQAGIIFMIYCDKSNHNNLSKKLGITYSHVCKLSKKLQRNKLITTKKEGRSRPITLTEKGIKLKKACEELLKWYQ